MLGRSRQGHRRRGQALVEFALIVPILLIVLLGAADFGRVMQARVTAEAATRAGASWGAGNLANANGGLDPVYNVDTNCANLSPSCNVEARSCAEAAGFPGYSGGPDLTSKDGSTYHDCANNYDKSTNTVTGVCTPSSTQSNPFLKVHWYPNAADAAAKTNEITNPSGTSIKVGNVVAVTGTFCFNTLFRFPAIPAQITFSVTSTYTVQP